ncbi:hypothetical protein HDV06_003819 [Boothiomyces sp. JEL0866]|nr:hypothetical protein HDV06_003819 [Boothiomyces sp. JEL0866]
MIPTQTNYSYEHQLRKEVQLLNEQKISQTSYTQLFRATRSMQTEDESIPAEVDQAREDIEAAMGKDVQMLITSFTSHLEKQAEQMKKRYDEALERIMSAGRTNLANSIATIHKTEQMIAAKNFKEFSDAHRNNVKGIDDEIKKIKKSVLGIESMLIKYRLYVEKATMLAKKSAIDLDANPTNEPTTYLEQLDGLQKSLDNREHQFMVLSERLSSKPPSQRVTKKKKVLPVIEQIELRPVPEQQSPLLKKESRTDLYTSFNELSTKQLDVDEILAAMKTEFEKAKEEELKTTKETLEDFQSQFENLRLQARESKLNLANEKYLNISKQLFGRYKHSHTQCNIEELY